MVAGPAAVKTEWKAICHGHRHALKSARLSPLPALPAGFRWNKIPSAGTAPGGRLRVAVAAACLAAVTLAIYWPAMRGGWLWDDRLEIGNNPLLRDPAGWWKAWAFPGGMDYFPLKDTLQWIEWHLWAADRAGYHAVNVILHVCSALLLWRLLARLGVATAWLGGLIFAVHPVAVESVAWISEFKNAVALPPLLAALGAFMDWDSRRSKRAYAWSVLWFAAAMLCKSTAVMFPVFLAVFGWWRRGRLRRSDLAALAPFVAVSAALGLATLRFQWSRAIGAAGLPVGAAASWTQAGWSLLASLRSLLWPSNLAPVYGPIRVALPGWTPWLLIAAAAGLCWAFRRGWGRHALLCLAWVLLNLLPVAGLVPMAYMRVSPRADHLAYLSLAGMAGGAAAIFGTLWKGSAGGAPGIVRGALACVAAACVAALAFESRGYAAAFRDEHALWSLGAARSPNAWLARSNWGRVLLEENRPDLALAELEAAARLEPDSAEVRANLGDALERCGRREDALAQFRASVAIEPGFEGGHYDLGRFLLESGRTPEAEAELRIAVRLNPGHAQAHNNLGLALARLGRLSEAVGEYRAALALAPDLPEARLNLGNACFSLGRVDEAVAQYREAIRRRPNYAAAHRNLGVVLQSLGRYSEAQTEFAAAARFSP